MKKLMTMLALLVLGLAVVPACSSSNTNAPADEAVTEESTAPAEAVEEPAEAAEPAETAETAPDAVLPNDGTRQIGEVTKCAVSGDVFTITETTPKAEYEGGTYYFCCKGCINRFNEDPAKYTQAAEAPAEEATEEAAEEAAEAETL